MNSSSSYVAVIISNKEIQWHSSLIFVFFPFNQRKWLHLVPSIMIPTLNLTEVVKNPLILPIQARNPLKVGPTKCLASGVHINRFRSFPRQQPLGFRVGAHFPPLWDTSILWRLFSRSLYLAGSLESAFSVCAWRQPFWIDLHKTHRERKRMQPPKKCFVAPHV